METNWGNGKKEQNGDRIINLPDPILHQILSSIDMKCVVQMSILSRRLRDLWTYLPYLNFDHELFPIEGNNKKEYFMDFVDRVIFARNGATIQKFQLFGGSYCDFDRIDSWVGVAVRCKVQELHLNFSTRRPVLMLPHSLFTCKSLTVLKFNLGSDSNRPELILPDSSALTGLKTLHLGSFSLVDGELAGKFFSSCPVLETLIITNCSLLTTTKDLHISALQLKKLVIEISVEDYEGFGHIQIFNGPVGCKIKISAPNLTSFRCRDYMARDYTIENICFPYNADMDLILKNQLDNELTALLSDSNELLSESKEIHAKYVVDWLGRFYDVKALSLSSLFIWVISDVRGIIEKGLPAPFFDLRYLKVKTTLYAVTIRGILYLLPRCPCIESLVFEIAGKNYRLSQIYQSWDEAKLNIPAKHYWESLFPSQCSLNHLKSLEIWNLFGYMHEVVLLKFLLKNAPVLERLTIHPSDEWKYDEDNRLVEFGKELQTFPRASPSVKTLLLSPRSKPRPCVHRTANE
ncbi:putative FBD-associated F-box protein At5g53635 [Macadamia integrifolia]|uniref:putative FBD-associated F-box protein At5g53635 n=1 Tax=Macadamia integrifolia TaxID=60698 RepID=UPI001C4FD8E5|nr:putative FBD-associated F-box protein At5g53635 [Macadamia integrifolia]